jgi:SlyX protein
MSAASADNNDRRLENLEAKAAYQERTIEELNEVVIKQQQQIDQLIEDVRRLQMAGSGAAGVPVDSSDESPPPHY